MKLITATLLLSALLSSCKHKDNTDATATGDNEKTLSPEKSQGLFTPGKYNMYQNDAMGFSFQYSVTIGEDGQYKVHEKAGDYEYKDGVLTFTSGQLKGFKGVFLSFSPEDNRQKRLTLMIDYHGDIPDSVNYHRKQTGWYQYGHLAK